MKTALFIGVSLTLVALPAAAQYARAPVSQPGGYRGGNIPEAPSISHKRYAALESCTSQAQTQVPDRGQSDLSRDRYFIYRACMNKQGLRP
jgi:hypothetical protein